MSHGRGQVLVANFAAGSGKQESQEVENEGDFLPTSLTGEAVHSGLKRIMKVGGLKIKFKKAPFKKYTKRVNNKIFSFTPSVEK